MSKRGDVPGAIRGGDLPGAIRGDAPGGAHGAAGAPPEPERGEIPAAIATTEVTELLTYFEEKVSVYPAE
jgi:hypothetical protein